MSEFYNITYDPILGIPTLETTITQTFLSLQSQVLNSFLYAQVFFLLVVLLTLDFTSKKDCLWTEFETATKEQKQMKILRTICYISLPLAFYGVLLCISVKMELNL